MTDHQLDPEEATQTVRSCVCSDCWGQLVTRYNPTLKVSIVACSTPGCACSGFVSRKWVEKQEAKSGIELIEAKQALRRVLPEATTPSAADLIKQLGF